MHSEWHQDQFTVSTDPARLDVAAVHQFLVESDWAEGIPVDLVARALANSLGFGVDHDGAQIGLARLVTDRATFAYLGDVYSLEPWRGCALAKWLMTCVNTHPDLQGLRRFNLVTRDAHALYRPFGFPPSARPENYLEKLDPGVYKRAAAARSS